MSLISGSYSRASAGAMAGAERRGTAVEKDELELQVWRGAMTEDGRLEVAVKS